MSHQPVRTCLACGRKTSKRNLLRVSRYGAGRIAVDPHQRLPGRGAYVCPTLECANLLRRRKGLHHGLRAPVPEEVYSSIIEFVERNDTE